MNINSVYSGPLNPPKGGLLDSATIEFNEKQN
jgi:hypothetical protein